MSRITHQCAICGCYIKDDQELCITCQTIKAKNEHMTLRRKENEV